MQVAQVWLCVPHTFYFPDPHPERHRAISPADATTRMASQGVVDLFSDPSSTAGFLETVPEAVEDIAAVRDAPRSRVVTPPLAEIAYQRLVNVRLQVGEPPSHFRPISA